MSNPFPSFTDLLHAKPEAPTPLVDFLPQPRAYFNMPPPHMMHQHHMMGPMGPYGPQYPPQGRPFYPPGHPYAPATSPYIPVAAGPHPGFKKSRKSSSTTVPKVAKPSTKPPGQGRKPKSKHSSCEPCRFKKSKCDKRENCSSCRMRGDVCIWNGAAPVQAGDLPDFPDASTQALREIARLRSLVHNLAARLGVDPHNPETAPSTGGASSPVFSPSIPDTVPTSPSSASGTSDASSPTLSTSATQDDVQVCDGTGPEGSAEDDERTPTSTVPRLFEDYGGWYEQPGAARAGWPASSESYADPGWVNAYEAMTA